MSIGVGCTQPALIHMALLVNCPPPYQVFQNMMGFNLAIIIFWE